MPWRAVRTVALVLTSRSSAEISAERTGYSAVFAYMTARALRGPESKTLCQPYSGEAVPKIYDVSEQVFSEGFKGRDLSRGIQKLVVVDQVTFRNCGAGLVPTTLGEKKVCSETEDVYPAAPVENTVGLFLCIKEAASIAFHWVAITFAGPRINPAGQERFHVANSPWATAREPSIDMEAWLKQSLQSGGTPVRPPTPLSYPYLSEHVTAQSYEDVRTAILPGEHSAEKKDITWPVVVIVTKAPSKIEVLPKIPPFHFRLRLYDEACIGQSANDLQCRVAGLDPDVPNSPACFFTFDSRIYVQALQAVYISRAGSQLWQTSPSFELWTRSGVRCKSQPERLAPLGQPALAIHLSEFAPTADGAYAMRQLNKNVDGRVSTASPLAGGWTALSVPALDLQRSIGETLTSLANQRFDGMKVEDLQVVGVDPATESVTLLVRYTLFVMSPIDGNLRVRQVFQTSTSQILLDRKKGSVRFL
jgi:hypothetical protein